MCELRTQNAQELVRQLTELKYTITRANALIQRDIFDLAELKSEVTLLTGLNTKHGTFLEGYPNAGQVSCVRAVPQNRSRCDD